MSAQPRSGAVLFARNLDRVAVFYSAMLGLAEAGRGDDHILLEAPHFQLVVHRIVGGTTSEPTVPPARRATAAFKPVFLVPSIARLRERAESLGGIIEPREHEWSFNGVTVCDAVDPEGNVIQFREAAG